MFRPPCRKAVHSPIDRSSDINFHITNKRLPLQTLNIIPKIREVDAFLCEHRPTGQVIREIHPEICFWALSTGRPMQYSKKKQEGFFEREKMLRSVYPKTEAIINEALTAYTRSEVAKDDIIDALAVAVTAQIGFNRFLTVPEIPPVDSMGLRMEMVYFPLEGVG